MQQCSFPEADIARRHSEFVAGSRFNFDLVRKRPLCEIFARRRGEFGPSVRLSSIVPPSALSVAVTCFVMAGSVSRPHDVERIAGVSVRRQDAARLRDRVAIDLRINRSDIVCLSSGIRRVCAADCGWLCDGAGVVMRCGGLRT